jgi:festuclavine dehydrogenase
MSSKGNILLTGGTGKIASRIAPLLTSNGNTVLVASRSGKCPSLPNTVGVKFDWLDSSTYDTPFSHSRVDGIFLVAPPIMDCFPPMKAFIDLAVEKGVQRLVLLSASLLEVGDGPVMGQVSKYISELGLEWAVLRPTWFMGTLALIALPNSYPLTEFHADDRAENFSEMAHLYTIRDEDKIITATGDGKLPFVSADDIATVAFRALTDKVAHNTDHLILGPELLSYDEVSSSIHPLELASR